MTVSLGELASNDSRALYDPSAIRDDWNRLTGKAPPAPQVASQTYAALTREQWENYLNTFVPIENQLIKYATDASQPAQAMAAASADVNSSFGAQAGATARRLTGLGVNLNPEQQAASGREFSLAKSLADVQGQNVARDLTIQRQQSILGNPAPAVNPGNIPQGV